jgi:DNA-directed RNA polymerase subunit RPC12/RpoP
MVFAWFATKTKYRPVQDGKIFVGRCPECASESRFLEFAEENSLSAFSVIELLNASDTVYRCERCSDFVELSAIDHAQLDPAFQAARARLLAKEREVDRVRIERAKEAARFANQQRETAVTHELEAMKKRLGMK